MVQNKLIFPFILILYELYFPNLLIFNTYQIYILYHSFTTVQRTKALCPEVAGGQRR